MKSNPHHAHWNHVARHWQQWEPPLRPCPSDICIMERLVSKWLHGCRGPSKALLWGVTPEIADMAWPEGTELLAVDRSEEMIEFIWPGDLEGRRTAVCASWLEHPIAAGGYDTVIGDGVFTLVSFPGEYGAMAAQAHRLLNADGILVTRLFVRPPQPERPETVLQDLRAGRIGNFHIFKLRLAMSLQPCTDAGVRMRDVFDAWNEAGIDPDELAASMGWRREAISTVDHYRDADSRLSFPTLAEFDTVFKEFFVTLECCFPTYEMGDRTPIICCRRRTRTVLGQGVP